MTSRSAGWSAHASTAGASRVASVLRLRACPHHYPGRIDRDGSLAPLGGFPSRHRPSLDARRVGSCIDCFGACSVFTRVRACLLAGSPKAIRYIRGFSRFVTSTTAPIATGWSDPVPGRDLHPLKNSAFPRRTSSRSLRVAQHPTLRWFVSPTLASTDPNFLGRIHNYLRIRDP